MIRRGVLTGVGVGVGVASGLIAVAALAAPTAPRARFEISQELEARVAAHHDLFVNAGRSLDDFCKLMADTVQILDPVVLELSRFGGSEDQSAPFAAIERAYTRTERLVPGLSLVAKEEFTQTGIDYRALAKLGPPEARALLRAMGNFELGADGIVSWGTRATDASACEAPERGRAALAALVKSWSDAPDCLREALRARLDNQLETMTGWDCFCAERTPALAAVRKSARLLKGLSGTRGPELADRWLDRVRAPDTRFSCNPS